MLLTALTKLDKEVAEFKGDNKATVVHIPVADTLKSFCRQDAEFAQAVAQSDKTLSDCCKEIMKGVGGAVSDLEVYKKAVQFYFAGAEIEMNMTIKVNPAEDKPESGINNIINLNLDDLFD